MPYLGNTAGNGFVASQPASVYSGDGSTTVFTLEHSVGSDEDILVSVDGVVQEPSVAYAVSGGTTLTFTSAPSNNTGNNIFVYYLFRTVATVDHPSTSSLLATNGTFSGDLTISDKIIHDGDTNTAIRFPSADTVTIETGGSERARVDSSGNLLVGTSDTTPFDNTTQDDGVVISPNGWIAAARDSQVPAIFNRTGSDGGIIQIRKDGTSIGLIGIASSTNDLYINSVASNHKGLRFGSGAIVPINNNAGTDDGTTTLGGATQRFNNLFLAGGVYLGGTGSANYLDDYEEGTWTASLYGTSSGSGTNVTHTAHYSKVGNIVTVGGYFQNINLSSMSGSVNIAGLPFTATGNNYTGSIILYGFTFSGYATPYVGPGGTTIDILDSVTGSAWAGVAIPAAAGKYVMFSLTYRAS